MSLHDELARARVERDRLNVVIDYLERRLDTNGVAPRRARDGRLTTAQAAEQVLAGHDGPMSTGDLLRAVQDAGAQIKDADGLYKTLRRSDRFARPGRGLWALRD